MSTRQYAVTAKQLIRLLERMDPDKFVFLNPADGYCCGAEEAGFDTEDGRVSEIRLHSVRGSER